MCCHAFAAYPEWATYIQELVGEAQAGAKLRLVEGPPGRRPYVVEVPVLEATPGVRLPWAAVIPGAAWVPSGVFRGVHEFQLAERPDGTTRLTHRETFGGLLSLSPKEGPAGGREGFTAFNQALKNRVEAPVVDAA